MKKRRRIKVPSVPSGKKKKKRFTLPIQNKKREKTEINP